MRTITFLLILCTGAIPALADVPTAPDLAKVDADQRATALQELRFGMFICWSFSTFSGYEWTPGVEDINFFNPTGFDPDQWCQVAKDAGMNYILFLTKHHDGFCLWDTETTDRNVTQTKAMSGVDVLAEVRKACDRHGLKLALYFSEGDWSWSGRKDIHKSVSRPEIKKAQLKELLTQYGPIEFFWMDHAINDGGLSHAETVECVHRFQPDCFVGFNSGDRAGRLAIRERGQAGAINNHFKGDRQGQDHEFLLAEFTYPILEGQKRKKLRGAQWFYSLPENDRMAASAEKIYADYLAAKEFGNIFSLDVGPDRSGRIRPIDVETLTKVGQYIRNELTPPDTSLGQGKRARASGVWGPGYEADKAFDGDPATRWGAPPESRRGWLEVDLRGDVSVARVIVDEGDWDRVRRFELQVYQKGMWTAVAQGQKIGPRKPFVFEPVRASKVRLNILEASEVPTILEVEIHAK